MGNTQKTGNYVNAIFQDTSNNIGIGGSPSGSYKFEVTGTAKVSTSAYFAIASGGVGIGGTSLTAGIPLSINVATSNNCNIAFQENSSDKWYLRNITSSNAFSFYSVSGSTEVMRLTSAGNVGIGISSPSSIANGYTTVGINGVNGAGLSFNINGASANSYIYTATDGFNFVNVSGSYLFYNTGTERMRITSTGNVGIGTSSPNGPLDVVGPLYGGLYTLSLYDNASVAADIGGGIYFGAKYNSTTYTGWAGILGRKDNATSGEYGGYMSFLTRTNGSAPTERMRITSGGDVFVGFSGSAPGQRLRVQGADSGSANYSLVVANSTTASTFLVRNDGAVQVVGSLSKGSGSFRIDHPLESMTETHQLVHSFIEGPRVDLIYRGKLTLVNGKAQANIDEVSTMTEGTFEVLCREVQCFTTNESGWDLVKGKVIGNIIYIESQNPNSTDEISWMVIGERKDKHIMDTEWTDDNGKVIVEPLKPIETSEPITN